MKIIKSFVSVSALLAPVIALAHPGHVEGAHVHGPQHIEVTIALASLIAVVYLYRRIRNKRLK